MRIFGAALSKTLVNVWFLGALEYQPAYRIQQLLAAQHSKLTYNQANTLLIVEHKPGIPNIVQLHFFKFN